MSIALPLNACPKRGLTMELLISQRAKIAYLPAVIQNSVWQRPSSIAIGLAMAVVRSGESEDVLARLVRMVVFDLALSAAGS